MARHVVHILKLNLTKDELSKISFSAEHTFLKKGAPNESALYSFLLRKTLLLDFPL